MENYEQLKFFFNVKKFDGKDMNADGTPKESPPWRLASFSTDGVTVSMHREKEVEVSI